MIMLSTVLDGGFEQLISAVVAILPYVVITGGALLYTFYIPEAITAGPEQTRVTFLNERKEAVYENLRDLNFEYKAGKVPDLDYQTMRTSLEDEAVAILAEIAQIESGGPGVNNKKAKRN